MIERSADNSVSSKGVFAECPEGKEVVGRGYRLNGFAIGSIPNLQTSVVIDEVLANSAGVTVSAVEEEPFAGDWSVDAQAICATEGTP